MHKKMVVFICTVMSNTMAYPADPFSTEQESLEIQALHRCLKKRDTIKKTTHHEMAAQQIAERLPLLTQHMPANSMILHVAQKNANNAQRFGIEILKRCDQLEELLRQPSHTATLLYGSAEFNYCPTVLISCWAWMIKQIGIITEEEYLRRHIAVILMPENIGELAQHPDSQMFWNASHAVDRDAEKELEHFKHAIRTLQQQQ